MTENLYTQYANKYYNPNDGKKPGDNENWESIQKGFSRIGSTQLETSEGLTLGKGTEDETSLSAAELEGLKNPTQLETSGGLTLGKGTDDEVSVTAQELGEMKEGAVGRLVKYIVRFAKGTTGSSGVGEVSPSALTYNITGLKPSTKYSFVLRPTFASTNRNVLLCGGKAGGLVQTDANGDLLNFSPTSGMSPHIVYYTTEANAAYSITWELYLFEGALYEMET